VKTDHDQHRYGRRLDPYQQASITRDGQARGREACIGSGQTSKSAAVVKLLALLKGATVDEMMTATGWQPHSVRAFLSGLRKRGQVLIREERKDGRHAYGAGAGASPPPEDAGSITLAPEA